MEYDVIRGKIKRSGINITELAEKAGLSRTTIYTSQKWDTRSYPKDKTFRALDDALFLSEIKEYKNTISFNYEKITDLESDIFLNLEKFERTATKILSGFCCIVQAVKYNDKIKILEGGEYVQTLKDLRVGRECRGKKLDRIENKNTKIIYIEYIAETQEEFEEIIFEFKGGL